MGVTYKSFQQSNAGDKHQFWSTDLGIIMHLNRSLDLGFVGNNVLVDEDIGVSPSFESGILFKNRDASIKIYSDAVFDRSNTKVHGPDIRYGLDYELTPDFTFRVGANQTHYSLGASFDLFALSVDYAYKQSKKDGQDAIYALGFKIGRARQPDEFRRKYAMFKPNSIAYLEINGSLTGGYSSISLLGGKK